MAAFTSIYNGLITLIETKLSTYTRLADAYDLENNDILRIVKGYSLAIADGVNTERTICNELSVERNFIFKLTNLMSANELDPIARAVIEKSIIEDAILVWKELQKTHYLGTVQVSSVKYLSDEGLEYIFKASDVQSSKAIGIASLITLEYFE